MGKSQESFNKKEKEKKRQKKKKEKRERREQRKVEREETGPKSFEDMITYVDIDGNLTKTKPDPMDMKIVINLEDIVIGAPPKNDTEMDKIRVGRVKFFNDEKGYGFIVDKETKESVFVHINSLSAPIKENDVVSFEVEMGQKGVNAVRVKHYDEKAALKKKEDAAKAAKIELEKLEAAQEAAAKGETTTADATTPEAPKADTEPAAEDVKAADVEVKE